MVESRSKTDLLIIGAGPFGLALAAQAQHDHIDHLIVGKPMEFWRANMPKGMFLRSACDWHLDPQNVDTIEAYLQSQGKTPEDVEPLSLDFYLTYTDWFQQQKNIQPEPVYIERLDSANGSLVATTVHGDTIHAKNVALAPGFKHFPNIPEDLKAKLPAGRFQHTCNYVDFTDAKDRRYLIIGGRQSAFEWAALLLEAGAAAVHLSHRHASPEFTVASWSWIKPLVDNMVGDPSWFRRLSQKEKDDISYRMWSEGRLKLEPWLEPRLQDERVKRWPQTELAVCRENESGALAVTLSNGAVITVDEIILATGYKVEISRLPILAAGNLLTQLEIRNGFPVLDDHFETSVPGLFITSMPAVQDFGPFFGFTNSVRTSARLIAARLTP
ncbi:MAG TPA: NAD(P)-binding domain-containing protein [Pyrinomonadaceae bacterium]|nr:NAD(P)-binding domain-containing protein [Pyrinomonadaceae bacterium]